MITQEDLVEAGFKKFNQPHVWQFTSTGWQTCIRDVDGKRLYFITIAEYDNSKHEGLVEIRGMYSFQPEGQFNTANGVTFNIEMLSPNSIKEVFDFFENIYYRMDCKPYDSEDY